MSLIKRYKSKNVLGESGPSGCFFFEVASKQRKGEKFYSLILFGLLSDGSTQERITPSMVNAKEPDLRDLVEQIQSCDEIS